MFPFSINIINTISISLNFGFLLKFRTLAETSSMDQVKLLQLGKKVSLEKDVLTISPNQDTIEKIINKMQIRRKITDFLKQVQI